MMFGVVGTHRSGKTTLARELSERLGIHFQDSSFGRIAKDLGYDSVAPMSLSERIDMQEKVLDRHIEEIKAAPRPCLTDRTPMDMITYTLGEIGMHHDASPELQQRILAYVQRCIDLTKQNYDTLIVCKPLPGNYKVEEGKPPPNIAYQHHLQFILEGALKQVDRTVTVGILNVADLETRISASAGVICERLEQISAQKRTAIYH